MNREGKRNTADRKSKIKGLTHVVFNTHDGCLMSSFTLRMSGKDHVYSFFEEVNNRFFHSKRVSPKWILFRFLGKERRWKNFPGCKCLEKSGFAQLDVSRSK